MLSINKFSKIRFPVVSKNIPGTDFGVRDALICDALRALTLVYVMLSYVMLSYVMLS